MFDSVLYRPIPRRGIPAYPSFFLLSFLVFPLITLFLPVQAQADPRSNTVNGKNPAQYIAETQGNAWAVIIGIDKYLNLADLAYAVDDAKSVAGMLKGQGFKVTSLYNTQATRTAILRELRQNLLTRVQKDDRVIIFFAGHIGETPGKGNQQPVGYMMPVDTEPGLLPDTAISVEILRELSEALPAKQVLFLIDICYGGIAGRSQRSFPPMTGNYLEMITSEPARQLITAGGTGQQALAGPKWKHSVFTYYLLEGIGKGRGDLNGDGIIPTSELFTFLDEHVQSAALTHKHVQRPEMWGLSPDKGEFVFIPEKKSSGPQIANNPNRQGGTSNAVPGTVETIVGILKSFGNPLDVFNNKVPSGKSEQAQKQKSLAEEAATLKAEREKFELQALQTLKEQRQREKDLQAQLAEAQRVAAEEERRRLAAEQARQEQAALLAQEQAALKAEQARVAAEEEQRRKTLAEQEQTRLAQLAEAQRLAAEEERRRVAAEQARQEQETFLAQQEAALEAQQARMAAEEEQRQLALTQLAEAKRVAAEEERRRVAAEKARHEQAILLAQQQAALEAQQAKLAAEEERRKQLLAQQERELQTQLAIAQRMVAEEERRRAEAEQVRLAEEEERQKKALAQRELTRQAQLAEARRMAEEQARVEAEEQRRKEALAQRELTRQMQLAEARRMAEEQRRQEALAKQEQTRQAQLAEAQRVAAEEQERKEALARQEQTRQAQLAEAQRMAAEQARLKEEAALKAEQARLATEEQQRRQAAEARRLADLEEERERVARLKEEAALNARKARIAAEEQQRQEAAEARRLADLEEERRRVAAEKERKELEAKVAQPQIVPNGGNKQAATPPQRSSSPGTVSAFTPPPPTPPVVDPPSNESSGFFGFFENMFNKDTGSPPATSDQPVGSQPEAVLEARLHPQNLPGAVQSALSGKDSVPMILIPAGEFRMGSTDDQISGFLKDFEGVRFNAFQSEIPQRQVSLNAYYIDQYEVSYRRYREFLESTGRDAPAFWENERFHQPDHPVLGVTWYDATAYCTWSGKRLPTEAEWEQAARGPQGYVYPWGNTWDSQRTNTASYWAGKPFLSIAKWAEWMQTALDQGKAGPLEAGTFSNGVSPFGVHDMAGNVSEWVFDWYSPYESQPTLIQNPSGPDSGTMKVHRGGSWSVSSIFARSTYRARENPEKKSPYIGMRCAKSYQ
ncbi:SUMF1/EgtB/PvdO family nonheme iron enzyme [uncultured Nitrospira sp.]|uniref:SUMF1/EgtB/PvdO family nonheme iron enzyme n=1 Tax=uncultured Nitrospira sp. TaxID=157176 RepID=UPI00313FF245